MVSDSFNVNFKLFLNPMQFDPKLTNVVSKFTFFQFKVFFGLNLILQRFFINVSEPGILIFHSMIVKGHELNFIFVYFF